MSFFKKSVDKADLEQSTGGKYINGSGVYAVNIVAPIVSAGKNGGISIDLYVNHKDQAQMIYGNLRIENNNGDVNKIGAKTFNQLLVIADVDDVADPIEAELPIGKKEALKDVSVLEDLADINVIVRIQQEYSVWKTDIKEKSVIRGFYRTKDNASAEEIVNETEAGKQYESESKYFDNVTYKDGLDAEIVEEWIKAKRPKGTGGGSTSTPPKTPSFGKPRTSFGKK